MLIVTYNYGPDNIFNIGDGDLPSISEIKMIRADRSELERILSWGYPNHNNYTQCFYGDMAKQIALNWE